MVLLLRILNVGKALRAGVPLGPGYYLVGGVHGQGVGIPIGNTGHLLGIYRDGKNGTPSGKEGAKRIRKATEV